MSTAIILFKTLRSHQWIKNGFVLLPLVFAQKIFDIHAATISLLAVVIFSGLASSVYVFNDLADVEADRRHPVKKKRPLAAGLISPRSAVVTAVVLLALVLSGGFWLQKKILLFSHWVLDYPTPVQLSS